MDSRSSTPSTAFVGAPVTMDHRSSVFCCVSWARYWGDESTTVTGGTSRWGEGDLNRGD